MRQLPIQAWQNFEGKVIIVTGGSSGIGRATAQQFARQGGYVLIVGRRSAALEATIQNHERMAGISADVSREGEAATIVARALRLWGRIDVLVNNAGAFDVTSLETVTTTQITTILQTNIIGPAWLSQAALPALTETRGAIVNVSSISGQKPLSEATFYAASKAALDHLTRCWALELAPRGIRVNAVAPGPTDTSLLKRSGLPEQLIEHIKQKDCQMIPLGRRGTPEEVAAWIVALADLKAGWITGHILTVDGGMILGTGF